VPVPWRDDFAEARNAVLAAAESDWLLHLDADEMLDPAGAAALRRLVDDDGAGADAVELTIANYCDDVRAWRWEACRPGDPYAQGFSGYVRTELLRLFRNGRGFEYREAVHENITESVRERGGVIGRAPVVIHHYGYSPGTGNPEKARRYLEIARKKVAGRAGDAKAWHDLAEQLSAVGETAEAERACREALRREPGHAGAVMTLANLLCNRGALTEARGVLERALERGLRLPHLLTALGAIALRQGETERAVAWTEAAAVDAPGSVVARLEAARAWDVAGAAPRARAHLEAAAGVAPGLAEVQARLRAHALREGLGDAARERPVEALRTLVEVLRLDGEDPVAHGRLAGVLEALGELERAAAERERAARLGLVIGG
jgi:Tfp pilus assembly protein PilF